MNISAAHTLAAVVAAAFSGDPNAERSNRYEGVGKIENKANATFMVSTSHQA